MKNIYRDFGDFEPQKFHRTPEGYLTGLVRVTGAGVFPYIGADGEVVRILRPLSEVGDIESYKTLDSKPVTYNHPDEQVTPDNVKKYEVGFTGTDSYWDGLNVWVTLTVTERKAIEAMERGDVRAVSCGYETEVTDDSGNWQGTEYTRKQTAIRYNHVALVKAGRAGDAVRFRVGDSANGKQLLTTTTTTAVEKGGKEGNMKKIMIDSVEYDADEKVIDALQAAQKEVKELRDSAAEGKKELDKVTAERDAAQAEAKKLKDEALDDKAIQQKVNAKIALLAVAKDAGVEVKAEDSDDSVRVFVIKKVFDGMDLEGKSDDYKLAMFDAAAKVLKGKGASLAPDMTKVGDSADVDPEKAYKKMCESIAADTNQKKEA